MFNGTDSSVTSLRLPIYANKNASRLATVAYKRHRRIRADHRLPVSQPTLSSCSVCGAPFADAREHRSGAHVDPDACHACRRHEPGPGRERGLVLGFNRRRKFGFLRAADGRRVYCSGAQVERGRRLRKGDLVAFRRVAGRKGPEAQDVIVEASAASLKAWAERLAASANPVSAAQPAGRDRSGNKAGS